MAGTKILIVEDEAKTAAYLRRGLTENGFAVEVSEQGEDGLHRTLTQDYHLLILDIMLPRLGVDVCRCAASLTTEVQAKTSPAGAPPEPRVPSRRAQAAVANGAAT
jgi:DNA-binding response OmpR family regulator